MTYPLLFASPLIDSFLQSGDGKPEPTLTQDATNAEAIAGNGAKQFPGPPPGADEWLRTQGAGPPQITTDREIGPLVRYPRPRGGREPVQCQPWPVS